MTESSEQLASHFPLAGCANDGWSTAESATATCFCGKVQLSFPTQPPGLMGTFVCHCTDCRKITASMFASNFTIANTYLTHVRGQDNLTAFGQSHTIASGKKMTNYFCATCGTLMYRAGERFPDRKFLRIGTVDDFHLHETKLKPQREIFVKDRVSWCQPLTDAEQMGAGKAPNRVCTLCATEIGGYIEENVGQIWWNVVTTDRIVCDCTFAAFANAKIAVAKETLEDEAAEIIRAAWN